MMRCSMPEETINLSKAPPSSSPSVEKTTGSINLSGLSANTGSTVDVVPPNPKYRHDYCNSPTEVVVTIFAKNVPKENVSIEYGEQILRVVIDAPGEDTFLFQTRLFAKIIPEKCRYTVFTSKIEIRLSKAENITWTSLELNEKKILSHKLNATPGLQPEDGASDGFEKSEVPLDDKEPSQMGQNDDSTDNAKIPVQTGQPDGNDIQHDTEADYPILNERQKKLLELSLKMSEARKANQTAMVAEKKKMEAPTESRGVSKQTWIEDRKKKIGKSLDSNGLDMSKAYMLDTQDQAQAKYKKWEKDPAPSGWEVFNQKTLYNAYKKRTKNVNCDFNKAKEADPEFYRDAVSLQYGKATKVPDQNTDRMVKELEDTKKRREAFSRRRKFHEDKDVDSINDRNEHFNKKIERAFGKYTLEMKNNLERGTALPD